VRSSSLELHRQDRASHTLQRRLSTNRCAPSRMSRSRINAHLMVDQMLTSTRRFEEIGRADLPSLSSLGCPAPCYRSSLVGVPLPAAASARGGSHSMRAAVEKPVRGVANADRSGSTAAIDSNVRMGRPRRVGPVVTRRSGGSLQTREECNRRGTSGVISVPSASVPPRAGFLVTLD